MPKATRKTSVDEMLLALSDSTEQKPDIANDEKQTPDSSPSKSKAKSARSSPTMPKTYDSNAKALFAKMIVDAGIKSLTKAEVQQAVSRLTSAIILRQKVQRGAMRFRLTLILPKLTVS